MKNSENFYYCKAGGFGASKAATEEIQELVNGLRTEIEGRVGASFTVFTAATYTSQVVAGTNYLVDVEVDEGKSLRVKIFRPLPHTNEGPKLTEAGFVWRGNPLQKWNRPRFIIYFTNN